MSKLVAVGALVVLVGLGMLCWMAQPQSMRIVGPSQVVARSSAVTSTQPEVTAAIPELRDERALDGYLAELETEAKRTGHAGHDIAARGFAAIRQLAPRIGRERALARAVQLRHELRRLRGELALAPTHGRLAELRTQIASANDRTARERLEIEYRMTARELPEPYRLEALTRMTTAGSR